MAGRQMKKARISGSAPQQPQMMASGDHVENSVGTDDSRPSSPRRSRRLALKREAAASAAALAGVPILSWNPALQHDAMSSIDNSLVTSCPHNAAGSATASASSTPGKGLVRDVVSRSCYAFVLS
jgi:hypothetical protein